MSSKRTSANDHHGLSFGETTIMIVTSMVLCVVAVLIGGSASMTAAFSVNLAVHFAIVVGSRAEGRAVFILKQESSQ